MARLMDDTFDIIFGVDIIDDGDGEYDSNSYI